MKYLLVFFALVAGTIAMQEAATMTDVFQELQSIVSKFTKIAINSRDVGSEKNLHELVNRLKTIREVLDDVYPEQEVEKRDNLIDKTTAIQGLLDKYVASIVNGTPLPPELVALGAEGDDPATFIAKIIIMAAGNLGRRRDLMTVSRVI